MQGNNATRIATERGEMIKEDTSENKTVEEKLNFFHNTAGRDVLWGSAQRGQDRVNLARARVETHSCSVHPTHTHPPARPAMCQER